MRRRRTMDERGNPVVEVRNRDGIFEREVDLSAIRKLDGAGLSIEERRGAPRMQVGINPYAGGSQDSSQKLKARSGLDYMRALSEEIKRKRKALPEAD